MIISLRSGRHSAARTVTLSLKLSGLMVKKVSEFSWGRGGSWVVEKGATLN